MTEPMLGNFKRLIRQSKLYGAAGKVKAVLEKHLTQTSAPEIFRCEPKTDPIGEVLLSYVTHAFSGKPIPYTHTAYWEARRIAEVFTECGYSVDVIAASEASDFQPRKGYSIFVGHRHNFDRIANRLGGECLKVLHCDVAHWLSHNTAGSIRLLELQKRRGVTLPFLRWQEPNRAIENADIATVLGNEFTIGTYRYAGKPIFRIPVSAPVTYPWPQTKRFDACRRTFLWFNSNGFVHKGLDLVLEAFADMPDCELIVCGPMEDEIERDFTKTYHRELYGTPNIHTAGWVEDGSEEFVDIANSCVAVISASCSEGGGASVISCMHAGLIPIANYETSVDMGSFGLPLQEPSIECIKETVRSLGDVPALRLQDNARQAWEFVRTNHTRERFGTEYSKFARMLTRECLDARKQNSTTIRKHIESSLSRWTHGVATRVQ